MTHLRLVIDRKVGEHTIAPVMKNNIISRKNGRLHIYKRKDDKSGNYVGRTYILGKDKVKTSGTRNKKEAIKILEQWYDKLQYKVELGLNVHEIGVRQSVDLFIKHIRENNNIEGRSKKSIIHRMNRVMKCEEFMNLKTSTLKLEDVNNTFVKWVLNQKSNRGVTYRGATIKGDLVTISQFLNWATDKGYRKEKVSGLLKLLRKDLRQQKTNRDYFSREEYETLKKVSRERIESCRSKHHKFDRQRLHQFIIFMVGTGLRVEESMTLHWEDIEFVDRRNVIKMDKTERENISHYDKHFIKINIRHSKVKKLREVIGMTSAHDALINLKKLYQINNIECTGNIWRIKTFRTALNDLLDEANLKTRQVGENTITRDSQSFRKTYMCMMINRKIPHQRIAQNCGTSTAMIDKFYAVYLSSDSLIDIIVESNSKN